MMNTLAKIFACILCFLLKEAGAQISQVQIYSGNAAVHARSGHLSLRVLSQIAQSIRQTTGLRVEVF